MPERPVDATGQAPPTLDVDPGAIGVPARRELDPGKRVHPLIQPEVPWNAVIAGITAARVDPNPDFQLGSGGY
jgi:hypothetical protein